MSHKVGFILLPGYSHMTYVSAIEPLLMCNDLLGEKIFETFTVALNDSKTDSNLDNQIDINYSLDNAPNADTWIVAGTSPDRHPETPGLDAFLNKQAPNCTLGGLASGSYSLAKIGLLNGYRSVVHWHPFEEQFEDHKSIELVKEQFSMDRDRLTCRGGTSSLDLMLKWISLHVSADTAEAISTHFVNDRLGIPSGTTQLEMSKRTRTLQPKLSEALELMENNIEEPLTTTDIASHVNVSRSHLERLFKKYVSMVPSRFYMQIRLEEASNRLFNSAASVSDIGLGCGFSSSGHFCTAFRNQSGLTPSEARSLNRTLEIQK